MAGLILERKGVEDCVFGNPALLAHRVTRPDRRTARRALVVARANDTSWRGNRTLPRARGRQGGFAARRRANGRGHDGGRAAAVVIDQVLPP